MKRDISEFNMQELLERYKLQSKIIELLKAAHQELKQENYPRSFIHLFSARRYARKMLQAQLFLPDEAHIPTLIQEQMQSLAEAKVLRN